MSIDAKLIREHSKELNLLYVEDDLKLQRQTVRVFELYFKTVVTAGNGLEGLERFRSSLGGGKNTFDLVIADINMPKMNGIEMGEEIVKLMDDQPIIYISAHNEIEYLQKAIEMGASGFLIKPLQEDQLKRILYKTVRMIADRKLALEYNDRMIEDNLKLQNAQSDMTPRIETTAHTLRNIIDEIESQKEKLTHTWVEIESVREKLHRHAIDEEFFRTHYAIKVLEYFIGVIRGENRVGQCPVINALLEFFKHKHLPLESIFIICVNFKNTITAFVFDRYEFDHQLFDELSLVLDKNFEGVVQHYVQMKGLGPVEEETVPEEEASEETPVQLDYSEYVFEHDIYELKELEVDIENLAIGVTMNHNQDAGGFLRLGKDIKKYGTILTAYPVFDTLGACILKLGESFSSHADSLAEDQKTTANISTLLEGFVNDLMLWRREVFEHNVSDPNFLNASFFSNVDTIIQYIEHEESEDDEDGIEFF